MRWTWIALLLTLGAWAQGQNPLREEAMDHFTGGRFLDAASKYSQWAQESSGEERLQALYWESLSRFQAVERGEELLKTADSVCGLVLKEADKKDSLYLDAQLLSTYMALKQNPELARKRFEAINAKSNKDRMAKHLLVGYFVYVKSGLLAKAQMQQEKLLAEYPDSPEAAKLREVAASTASLAPTRRKDKVSAKPGVLVEATGKVDKNKKIEAEPELHVAQTTTDTPDIAQSLQARRAILDSIQKETMTKRQTARQAAIEAKKSRDSLALAQKQERLRLQAERKAEAERLAKLKASEKIEVKTKSSTKNSDKLVANPKTRTQTEKSKSVSAEKPDPKELQKQIALAQKELLKAQIQSKGKKKSAKELSAEAKLASLKADLKEAKAETKSTKANNREKFEAAKSQKKALKSKSAPAASTKKTVKAAVKKTTSTKKTDKNKNSKKKVK